MASNSYRKLLGICQERVKISGGCSWAIVAPPLGENEECWGFDSLTMWVWKDISDSSFLFTLRDGDGKTVIQWVGHSSPWKWQREHCKDSRKPLRELDLCVFCGLGLWPSSTSQVLGRGTSPSLFLYCKGRIRFAQASTFSFTTPLFSQQTLRTYFLPDVVLGLITQILASGIHTVKYYG